MLELSPARTQCTHSAAVKLFCRYLQDIGGHVPPSMLAKWVNGRGHPSYGGDAHGQGDHPLLMRVYRNTVVFGEIVVGSHYI